MIIKGIVHLKHFWHFQPFMYKSQFFIPFTINKYQEDNYNATIWCNLIIILQQYDSSSHLVVNLDHSFRCRHICVAPTGALGSHRQSFWPSQSSPFHSLALQSLLEHTRAHQRVLIEEWAHLSVLIKEHALGVCSPSNLVGASQYLVLFLLLCWY